jgi:hypothetical protein
MGSTLTKQHNRRSVLAGVEASTGNDSFDALLQLTCHVPARATRTGRVKTVLTWFAHCQDPSYDFCSLRCPSCYLPREAGSYPAEEVQAAHEPRCRSGEPVHRYINPTTGHIDKSTNCACNVVISFQLALLYCAATTCNCGHPRGSKESPLPELRRLVS